MTCLLPSSPNWFCSGVSAVDGHDLLAFGSRYQVVLLDLSTRLCVGVRLPPPLLSQKSGAASWQTRSEKQRDPQLRAKHMGFGDTV